MTMFGWHAYITALSTPIRPSCSRTLISQEVHMHETVGFFDSVTPRAIVTTISYLTICWRFLLRAPYKTVSFQISHCSDLRNRNDSMISSMARAICSSQETFSDVSLDTGGFILTQPASPFSWSYIFQLISH